MKSLEDLVSFDCVSHMFVRFSFGLSFLCAFAAWQTITLLQQYYAPEVAIANTPLFLREALSYSHVASGPKCIQILVHFTCRHVNRGKQRW